MGGETERERERRRKSTVVKVRVQLIAEISKSQGRGVTMSTSKYFPSNYAWDWMELERWRQFRVSGVTGPVDLVCWTAAADAVTATGNSRHSYTASGLCVTSAGTWLTAKVIDRSSARLTSHAHARRTGRSVFRAQKTRIWSCCGFWILFYRDRFQFHFFLLQYTSTSLLSFLLSPMKDVNIGLRYREAY